MQDAARPVLLLQLLQRALEAAPDQQGAAVVLDSAVPQNDSEKAWSVNLANAICQQVGAAACVCVCVAYKSYLGSLA